MEQPNPSIGKRQAMLLLAYAGATFEATELIESELTGVEQVLEATSNELEQAGLGEKMARRIVELRTNRAHLCHEEALHRRGCHSIVNGESGFPPRLAAIPHAPAALFIRGRLPPHDRPAVAVIGSRSCTPEGVGLAFEMARELALAGVSVISGLARGIDSAALRGSLAGGSCCAGVLGSGLDHVYPPENRRLFDQVAGAGGLISEFPLGEAPRRHLFPRRNRIISGLADAVLVVEASDRSGTLITVDCAIEQDRTVMAVPGPVGPEFYKGTNRLIRDGAQVILTPEDILASLGVPATARPARRPSPVALSDDEERVLDLCRHRAETPDLLAVKAGLDIKDLLEIVSRMERGGFLRRFAGPRFLAH